MHFLRPPAEGLELTIAIERAGRTREHARPHRPGRAADGDRALHLDRRYDGRVGMGAARARVPRPEQVEPVALGPSAPRMFASSTSAPSSARAVRRRRRGARRRMDATRVAASRRPRAAGAALRRLVASAFARLTAPSPAPTLDLTIHFRGAPPAGDHPFVLGRFRSRAAVDGLFEEDGELWSEDGRLLAQSRQLALLPLEPAPSGVRSAWCACRAGEADLAGRVDGLPGPQRLDGQPAARALDRVAGAGGGAAVDGSGRGRDRRADRDQLGLYQALKATGRAYDDAHRQAPTVREHAPWLRSMRDERSEYVEDKQPVIGHRADRRLDGRDRGGGLRGLVLLLLGLVDRSGLARESRARRLGEGAPDGSLVQLLDRESAGGGGRVRRAWPGVAATGTSEPTTLRTRTANGRSSTRGLTAAGPQR